MLKMNGIRNNVYLRAGFASTPPKQVHDDGRSRKIKRKIFRILQIKKGFLLWIFL